MSTYYYSDDLDHRKQLQSEVFVVNGLKEGIYKDYYYIFSY
jgi:antitoxin component YwqK of YwqJK toxin-antitoxin module